MKEAGYDGKPIVVLDPPNIAISMPFSLVTGGLSQKIGCTVSVQAMDWGTLVGRRAQKTPASEGRERVARVVERGRRTTLNAGVAGVCDKAFFGWYCSETMEGLRRNFVTHQGDPLKRKQQAEEGTEFAYDEVPYALWGEFVTPATIRKNAAYAHVPCPAALEPLDRELSQQVARG